MRNVINSNWYNAEIKCYTELATTNQKEVGENVRGRKKVFGNRKFEKRIRNTYPSTEISWRIWERRD